MIKHFIDTVEDLAMRAMLKWIDEENTLRKEKIKELEQEIEVLRQNQSTFEDTKKVVEAYTNLSKVIKKTAVTTVVTALIGLILYYFGIGGG